MSNKEQCLTCKYFNIDDKDGMVSTMFEYCEMKVPDFEKRIKDKEGWKYCPKMMPRIKCNCPFNLKKRKILYDENQHFIGIEPTGID